MKKGSYSVEAALIMPAVVLIIIAFLWFGFYMRDAIVTEVYSRSLLIDWESSVERKQSELKDVLCEALWCSDIVCFGIYEQSDKVRVSYTIKPKLNLIRIPIDSTVVVVKTEEPHKKIKRWKVWIDEAKELFLTEDENGS